MLPRITAYWDQPAAAGFREGTIYRLSRRLVDLDGEACQGALTSIRDAVVRHCGAVNDRTLSDRSLLLRRRPLHVNGG